MTLFLLWAILLSSAGNAFARANLETENRVWENFSDPNIRTTEIGSPTQEMHWANVGYGYETALDVSDGPNLYAYVRQNPWSKFDPLGLDDRALYPGTADEVKIRGRGQHPVSVESMRKNQLHPKVAKILDQSTIKTAHPHGGAAHGEYNKRAGAIVDDAVANMKNAGINPTRSAKNMSDAQAQKIASRLLDSVKNTKDPYVKWFNQAAAVMTQKHLQEVGYRIRIKLLLRDGSHVPTELLRGAANAGVKIPGLSNALAGSGVKYTGAALRWAGKVTLGTGLGAGINGVFAAQEYESDVVVFGEEAAKRMAFERTVSFSGKTQKQRKEDIARGSDKASGWFGLPTYKDWEGDDPPWDPFE